MLPAAGGGGGRGVGKGEGREREVEREGREGWRPAAEGRGKASLGRIIAGNR